MELRWRWQRTHVSQSHRLSASCAGSGSCRAPISALHRAIRSRCLASSARWAVCRALSSKHSLRRSRCRLPRNRAFFWLTLCSQVSSSSVWPCGTFESASHCSVGWAGLAGVSAAVSGWRMVIPAAVVGGKGTKERERDRETEKNLSSSVQPRCGLQYAR